MHVLQGKQAMQVHNVLLTFSVLFPLVTLFLLLLVPDFVRGPYVVQHAVRVYKRARGSGFNPLKFCLFVLPSLL